MTALAEGGTACGIDENDGSSHQFTIAAVPALGLGALGYAAFAWLNGLTTGI